MLRKFFTFLISFVLLTSSLPEEVFSSQIINFAPSVHNNASMPLIPQDMGNIMYDFYFGGDNTIINIQDLHADYATQKNIADIIDYLNDNYEIGSVYFEGAYGAVNMDWLKEETDSALRKAISQRLLRDGKISGAEYFLINNTNSGIKFKGIEDKAVYLENFKILGQMFDKEAENTELIKYIQTNLSKLIQTGFSAKNKRLYKLKQKYKLDQISDERYYSALEKAAKKSGMPYFNYRYISQYNSIIKSFGKINTKNLNKELKAVSEDLKNVLSFREYKQISDIAQKHPLEYIKRISFYLSSRGEADKYPNIKSYNLFLTAKDSFDYRSLLIQEDYLSRELLYANALTKNEEDLIFTYHYTAKLLNMLTNKLMSEDYAYMADNFARYSVLLENYVTAAYINDIKIQFSIASKFYENNLLRNNYFISNALNVPATDINPSGIRQSLAFKNSFNISLADMLKTTKDKVDILVSGGFHLQGMMDLMNANSVNYAIVMPVTASFDAKQTEHLFKREFYTKQEMMQNTYKVFVTGGIFNLEWQDPLKVIFSNFLNFSLLDELWKHAGDKNDYINDTLNKYLDKILSDKKISQTAKITKLYRQDEHTFIATVLIDGKETREFIISENENNTNGNNTGNSRVSSYSDAGPKKQPATSSIIKKTLNTTLMFLTLGIVGGASGSFDASAKSTSKEEDHANENEHLKYLPDFTKDAVMLIWPVESTKLVLESITNYKYHFEYKPFTDFIESAKKYKQGSENADIIFFIPKYVDPAFRSYYKDELENKNFASTTEGSLDIIKIDGMTFVFYPDGERAHNENYYIESLTSVYYSARDSFEKYLDKTNLPWRSAEIKYLYHNKEFSQKDLNIEELLINANPSIKRGLVSYIFYELTRVLTDIYNRDNVLTDLFKKPLWMTYMKGNWVIVYKEQNYDIGFLKDYFKVIRRHGFEAVLICPTRDKSLLSQENNTLLKVCYAAGKKVGIYKQQVDGNHAIYFIDVFEFPEGFDALWQPEVLKEIKSLLTKYSNSIIEFKGTPALSNTVVNDIFGDSFKPVVMMPADSSQEEIELAGEKGFPSILQQRSIADRAGNQELKYPHVADATLHVANVIRVVKALKRKSFLGKYNDQKASIVGVKIASDEHIFNSPKEEAEFLYITRDIGIDFVTVVIRDNDLGLKVLGRDTTVKENLKKLAEALHKIDKKMLVEYTFTRIDDHFDAFLKKFAENQNDVGYDGIKFDLFDCNEDNIDKFLTKMWRYFSDYYYLQKPDMSVYVSEKIWNKYCYKFLEYGMTRILSSKEELMDNDYKLNSYNAHYEISVYKNQHEYERKIQYMIKFIDDIYYKAKNPDGTLNYGEITDRTIRSLIEKFENSDQSPETLKAILIKYMDTTLLESRLLNILNKVLNSREITKVTFPVNLIYAQPLRDPERGGLGYNMNVINSMVSFMRFMKETKGIIERKYFAYKFAREQKIILDDDEEEEIALILRSSDFGAAAEYIMIRHPYFFDFMVESKKTLPSISRSFLLGLYTENVKRKYLEGAYGNKIYKLTERNNYDKSLELRQDLFDRFMACMILYKDKIPHLVSGKDAINGSGLLFDINQSDLELLPNDENKIEVEAVNKLIQDAKKYGRLRFFSSDFLFDFFDKYFSQFDGHIEKDLYTIRVGMMLILAASDLEFIKPVVADTSKKDNDVDRISNAAQLDILKITSILSKA
ncbi:MAG: hypothetical protein FWC88_02560 [Endomicrobia bacterium]|nr:hypothetical protein [Endomicrobiia bacterium]